MGQQGQDDDVAVPVAKIGDLTISQQMIRNAVEQQAAGQNLTPEQTLQAQGSSLNLYVGDGLAVLLAKKQGIEFPDSVVKQRIVQQLMGSARDQLMAFGAVKEGATDQELDAAYKKLTGRSLIEQRDRVEQEIDKKLANKNTRAEAQAAVARLLLIDKVKSKYAPSDEAVKQGFETYHLKVITITKDNAKGAEPKAKAEAILKEIKGGLSFDAAMDKYLPMPKGKDAKKPSQQPTFDIRRTFLENSPYIKPLENLNPGQVSDVLILPESASIYKLVDKKIELPKDFAKQLPALKDQQAMADASQAMEADIKKLDSPENVTWVNEGYHVLSDYFMLKKNPAPDQTKKIKDIFDRAMKLLNDPLASDVASGTAYLAFQDIESTLPADVRAKDAIEVLAAFTRSYPAIPQEIDLAEAYIKAGDAPNATDTLKNVSDSNSIHTDAEGKGNWTRILAALKAAETKQLIKPKDAKTIRDTYAEWKQNFSDQEKAMKERDEELKNAGKATPPTGTGTTPSLKLSVPKESPSKSGAKK